jgi:hypothetical protein
VAQVGSLPDEFGILQRKSTTRKLAYRKCHFSAFVSAFWRPFLAYLVVSLAVPFIREQGRFSLVTSLSVIRQNMALKRHENGVAFLAKGKMELGVPLGKIQVLLQVTQVVIYRSSLFLTYRFCLEVIQVVIYRSSLFSTYRSCLEVIQVVVYRLSLFLTYRFYLEVTQVVIYRSSLFLTYRFCLEVIQVVTYRSSLFLTYRFCHL